MIDFVGKLDVAEQLDPHAVGRFGRQVAQRLQRAASDRCCFGLVPIAGERFFVGLQDDQALVAVDDHQVAAGDSVRNGPVPTTAGISMPFGHDRGVAARPADFGDEAADELAIQIGGFAGREIVGQDHDRRSQSR